MYNFFTIKMI